MNRAERDEKVQTIKKTKEKEETIFAAIAPKIFIILRKKCYIDYAALDIEKHNIKSRSQTLLYLFLNFSYRLLTLSACGRQ